MEKQPKFLPNEIVFAIPGGMGYDSFAYVGRYMISSVKLVPECYYNNPNSAQGTPSKNLVYRYYGRHWAGEQELKFVFKDKDEFIEFLKTYDFPDIHLPQSPKP